MQDRLNISLFVSGTGTERLISKTFVVAIKVFFFLFSRNKTDRDGIIAGLQMNFLMGSESVDTCEAARA